MTPEGRIKLSISNYLAIRGDCFFWWQESQGAWDAKKKLFRKKKSKFQRNGIPDIPLLLKVHGYPPVFVGFEIKAPRGTQTESQKSFEKDLKDFGSFYFVVRSVEETYQSLELVKKHVIQLTQPTRLPDER